MAFDVSPDGRRFLMIKSDAAATLGQINAVQNWFEDLRRRVPRERNREVGTQTDWLDLFGEKKN